MSRRALRAGRPGRLPAPRARRARAGAGGRRRLRPARRSREQRLAAARPGAGTSRSRSSGWQQPRRRAGSSRAQWQQPQHRGATAPAAGARQRLGRGRVHALGGGGHACCCISVGFSSHGVGGLRRRWGSSTRAGGASRVDRGETPKHRGLAQAGFVDGDRVAGAGRAGHGVLDVFVIPTPPTTSSAATSRTTTAFNGTEAAIRIGAGGGCAPAVVADRLTARSRYSELTVATGASRWS